MTALGEASVAGPVVTVAMPTYNHAAFLEEAIASVLAQTMGAWELVIVDDGSTDGTLDIARRHQDPRITVLSGEHRGLGRLGESYQLVLDHSTAPLVAVLEGDDRWPTDKLARQVADFDDPAVVLSYGAGWLIDEHGCPYGLVEPSIPPSARTNRPTGSIIPALLSGNPVLAPTVVVRRFALEAVGGFWQPEGVPYVDHPTWLLLAMLGPFAYQSAPVGSWRRHSAQWTTRAVEAADVTVPESAYVGWIAGRYKTEIDPAFQVPSFDELAGPHRERAIVNRWRLALLAGDRATVTRKFVELIRSGRPRRIALALLGGALWIAGSDLEWIQRRRHRVSWPSRRHRRTRRPRSSADVTVAHDPGMRTAGGPLDARPLVSIVMPVFNGLTWIGEAVASVVGQQGVAVELIVLDGGSTDGTRQWLREHAPASTTLVLEPDRGQSDAIAKGLAMARGAILGWLNADDILEPGALQRACAAFAEHPEAAMVSGACELIDPEGAITGRIEPPPSGTRVGLLNWPRNLAQPSTFFTAQAFRATDGLDLSLHYAMDVDLWLKLARIGPAIILRDDILARFRVHPGAKSSRAATAMVREELRVRLRHGLPLSSRTAQTLFRRAYLRPAKQWLLARTGRRSRP